MKLRIVIKAMDSTMGPNGLVASLLVFGTVPSFPSPSITNWNAMERLNALTLATDELETIVEQK